MIEAYIRNLGKYNEGSLHDTPLTFPTTNEELQEAFSRVGIDGVSYEEYMIADYDIPKIDGLAQYLGEYENLEELNYLASLLDEKSDGELEDYATIIKAYGSLHSIPDTKDLINLADESNRDCFYFIEANNEKELGDYLIGEELDAIKPIIEEAQKSYNDEKGALARFISSMEYYIDGERYGRDYAINACGTFVNGSYVQLTDDITEYYKGNILDIPDEYRIDGGTSQEEQEENIKVLLIKPEQIPQELTIENNLQSFQKTVGGNIQVTYPFDEHVGIICHEEGKLEGLPLNRALEDEDGEIYDIIAGDFLLVGLGEDGNFTSLTDKDMKKFSNELYFGELFFRTDSGINVSKFDPAQTEERTDDLPSDDFLLEDDLER